MRRVLVTGAQGFIGRHLVRRLAEGGARVLGTGRSPALPGFFTHFVTSRRGPVRAPLFFDADCEYRQVALDDLRRTVDEFAPDCVFHLASATHSASEADLRRTNVDGTAALMDAIGSARLVLGSSGSVYGAPQRLPVDEEHRCAPESPYGASKLLAEEVARARGRPIVARIFNVIGPGQTETHVCGRIASQLALGSETLEVGPLHATRDLVDVRDVAEALAMLGERGEPGATYNVASGRECSIEAVVRELIDLSGAKVRLVQRDGVAAGIARQVADVRKLGMPARIPLRQSLADLLYYYYRLNG